MGELDGLTAIDRLRLYATDPDTFSFDIDDAEAALAKFDALSDLVDEMAKALEDAIRVADEAREEWDKAPSGMKAGKLLIALSDPSLKYRADITTIHAALSRYRAAVGEKS